MGLTVHGSVVERSARPETVSDPFIESVEGIAAIRADGHFAGRAIRRSFLHGLPRSQASRKGAVRSSEALGLLPEGWLPQPSA